MSETQLTDAIIRQAIELQRVSASDEGRALEIMADLERDLRSLLAQGNLNEATRREIEALLKEADKAIASRYATLGGLVDTRGIALFVAEQTVSTMTGLLDTAIKPTPERLASLSKDVLIDGAPSSAWWKRQAEATAFNFAREVRQGVIEGATNEQIVARIVGRGDEVGILDKARRDVRALVHSSVMNAANQARLETYRKNRDVIAGVRWLATLDSRTCVTCGALDGSEWDLEGKPRGETTLQFQLPPAHWNCRCVASPVTKGFDEILGTTGFDAIFGRGQQRASQFGPVDDMTFAAFLKRQSPEFVERSLGKRRAELWQQGRITLTDLVSGSGRELTLDELRAQLTE